MVKLVNLLFFITRILICLTLVRVYVLSRVFVRMFSRLVRMLVPSVVRSFARSSFFVSFGCSYLVSSFVRDRYLRLFLSFSRHGVRLFVSSSLQNFPFFIHTASEKLYEESGICLRPFPSARKIFICILFMRSFVRLCYFLINFNFSCPPGGDNNPLNLLGDPPLDNKTDSIQFITWCWRQDQ